MKSEIKANKVSMKALLTFKNECVAGADVEHISDVHPCFMAAWTSAKVDGEAVFPERLLSSGSGRSLRHYEL